MPCRNKKIKTAVENTFELCHEYHPSAFLAIHRISRRRYKGDEPGSVDQHTGCLPSLPQSHPPVPVTDRKAAGDSEGDVHFLSDGIYARVLGYVPKPYQAPDDINLCVIYEEYFRHVSLGSYRPEVE